MAMVVDESKTFKDMYEGLTKGDMEKVLTQYEKLPATLPEFITVFGDTLLHMAIYMDNEEMAREILKRYLHQYPVDLILKQNNIGDTVLHEVATKNMVNLARDLLDNVPKLLSISNDLGEKPLFKTADNRQLQMFNILSLAVNLKHKKDLDQHLTRKDKTNILHMAILAEYFDLAYLIAKRYPDLVDKRDGNGMLSLQLLSYNTSAFISSANYGLLKRFIFKYCFPTFENIKEKQGYKKEDQKDFYQLDSIEDEDLYNPKTKGYKKLPPTYNVCMCIASGWPMMKTIYKEFRKHEWAFRLAKLLIKQDTTWQENDSKKEEGKSSLEASNHLEKITPPISLRPTPPTSLLTATSNGIVEIVKEILRVYPQAVEHVNDEGQNILHVAIKHRQLEIFNHVMKMEVAMCRLVKKIDKKGYTILHQAGNISNYSGGTLPGPALQLQEELHWLERVRKIVPPHYVIRREKRSNPKEEEEEEMILSETADELFLRNHEELLKKAQEWLKQTSESCSTVAVLIASVAFVAAYTIPGGTDKKTGVPIFLHDSFFSVFIAMDVLSLVSSLASVVMFLSILTSPFQLHNFRDSLPRKLTLGFTFLFISVAVTMLAFAATIMLTIRLKKRWTTTLLYCLAFLPVALFATLQYPLYLALVDTMKYTLRTIKNSLPDLPCSATVSSIYNTDRDSVQIKKRFYI